MFIGRIRPKSADFRPADNENSLLILFQFGYTFKGRFINVLGLVLGFVPDLHQTPQEDKDQTTSILIL